MENIVFFYYELVLLCYICISGSYCFYIFVNADKLYYLFVKSHLMKKLLRITFGILFLSFTFNFLNAQVPCDENKPVPAEICTDAPIVCDVLDFCSRLPDLNNSGGPVCGGQFFINNTQWFRFIATDTLVNIAIKPVDCVFGDGGLGMQGAIVEVCPQSFPYPVIGYCQSVCSMEPFSIGDGGTFVIGKEYLVLLDGCGGSICDYSIEQSQGVEIPGLDIPNSVTGPQTVCRGQYVDFIVSGLANANLFEWALDGVTYNSGEHILHIQIPENIDFGIHRIYLSNASNACFSLIDDYGYQSGDLYFEFEVNDPVLSIPTELSGTVSICRGEYADFTVNNLEEANSFEWEFQGTQYTEEDQTLHIQIPLTLNPGVYRVNLINASNACYSLINDHGYQSGDLYFEFEVLESEEINMGIFDVCIENAPIIIDGRTYFPGQDQVYYSLPAETGCDTIVSLEINWVDNELADHFILTCQGEFPVYHPELDSIYQAGVYLIPGVDMLYGCDSSYSVIVIELEPGVFLNFSDSAIYEIGGSVTIYAEQLLLSSGQSTFEPDYVNITWLKEGEILGHQETLIVYEPGIYELKVEMEFEGLVCEKTIQFVIEDRTTSLFDEKVTSLDWFIVPNPAKDQIFIQSKTGQSLEGSQWQIIDLLGNIVGQGIIENLEGIYLDSLTSGIYLFRMGVESTRLIKY
jgi:hypothetical protein